MGLRAGWALPSEQQGPWRAAGGSTHPAPMALPCLPSSLPPRSQQHLSTGAATLAPTGSPASWQSGPRSVVPTQSAQCPLSVWSVGASVERQAVLRAWPHPRRCAAQAAPVRWVHNPGHTVPPTEGSGSPSPPCSSRAAALRPGPAGALCSPRVPSFSQAACVDAEGCGQRAQGWKAMDAPGTVWEVSSFCTRGPGGICILEAVRGCIGQGGGRLASPSHRRAP